MTWSHKLILGQSGSGKTMLGLHLAHKAAGQGVRVVVFDPIGDPRWPVRPIVDAGEFLAGVHGLRECLCVVDEAKTLWDVDQRIADLLLYRKRHDGVAVVLLAQRATMVRPNARDQCRVVYAFRQSVRDARVLADEWHDDLAGVSRLKPLHFIWSDGFNARRFRLDFGSGVPPRPVPL